MADDATVALSHIGRTPAYIQMMHGHKPRLDVGASSHLGRAAEQNPNIAGADFRKQCSLFLFRVCVVNKSNLLLRHTGVVQFCTNVAIDVERAIPLGCRHIAEN